MTVKRMLGAGALTFAVTVGGFLLPPAADELTSPTAVVPGATPASETLEAEGEHRKVVDMRTVDLQTTQR